MPAIYRNIDSWEIENYEGCELKDSVTALQNQIKGIILVYKSFKFEVNDLGIDIKMPSGDFNDLTNNIKCIQFILTQTPSLKITDSEIVFSNVDVGSTWLTFFIIGGSALVLMKSIAALVDKAIAVKSHMVTLKEQEEQLKKYQMDTKLVNVVVDALDTLKKQYMEEALDELENENFKYKDGEERDKTRSSIEKLIALMEKGMEIHASIDSPKEIQTVFPPLEDCNLLTAETTAKLLDKKDGENK